MIKEALEDLFCGFHYNMSEDKVSCGKLNIGLDLDGVVIDHTKNKIRVAKFLGFEVKAKETQSEILKGIIPEKKYRKLQKIIYGKITLQAPPMAGVLPTLRKISKDYNLFIISRRGRGGLGSARQWLRKYRVFEIIPKENIIFVKDAGDKNFWCKKLKIKIYLDDKVKVLDLLFSVPFPVFYNPHKVSHNKKYLEISSWKDFPALLLIIKRANLIIICGLPGTGKTTQAQRIARKTGAILLRTDVIRKETEILGYSEEEKQQVYDEMFLRAKKLLKDGKSVILDATFAKEKNRQKAGRIAGEIGADFEIIEVVCPEKIVRERMMKRVGDESEAKFKHYLRHKKLFEPIRERHIIIDTSKQSLYNKSMGRGKK